MALASVHTMEPAKQRTAAPAKAEADMMSMKTAKELANDDDGTDSQYLRDMFGAAVDSCSGIGLDKVAFHYSTLEAEGDRGMYPEDGIDHMKLVVVADSASGALGVRAGSMANVSSRNAEAACSKDLVVPTKDARSMVLVLLYCIAEEVREHSQESPSVHESQQECCSVREL